MGQRTGRSCCTTPTSFSATSRNESTVAIVRCATSATRTATRTREANTTTQTADPPTTTPQTSASAGETAGTLTSTTVPSTGIATQRMEPTSSVQMAWCTSQTRCSATGRTGSTVVVDLLVISAMKTVIDSVLNY